jgi:hypothetical protein
LGHFVDSYRQAGIDTMQGQTINDEDVENCSSELKTAVYIAQALVPLSAPMYMSDIALGPEMNFVSALYHMTRCVSTTTFASCCLVCIQHFVSFSYQGLLCFTLLCLLKYFLFVIYLAL